MCGIAGVWSWADPGAGIGVIKKMTDSIAHRGPDGEGFWHSEADGLNFGHRRLAIIDLSVRAKQPMEYMDRYVITYNGEIYNYIEIRNLLLDKGYVFNSDSDTEVVLAAYDYWGKDCLHQFDGMFAFAIFDRKSEELFCARDRFGEKPFYYAVNADWLVFASEMKALWAAGVNRTPNPHSMYLFLNFNLHENPEDLSQTFFSGIQALKRGHYFIMKKGQRPVQKEYWSIVPANQNQAIGFDEACQHFKSLLFKSVSRRLRSDVPVGTSLSGGLDSSAVALIMLECLKDTGSRQKTFSARFDDPDLDEGYYIDLVGKGRNLSQYFTYPDAPALMADLPKILHHQEEPFASASIFAQWEVFKLAAKEGVVVLLDGQGADEVLGGYSHFFDVHFREIYRSKGGKALMAAIEEYRQNNVVYEPFEASFRFKLETIFPFLSNGLRSAKQNLLGVGKTSLIHNELARQYSMKAAPFQVFHDLNQSLQYNTLISGLGKLLRFADRNSMAFSREVRLPFLSHELVEFVFSLPADYKIREGWTKAILRFSTKDLLPPEISWRKRKLGFQPPQQKWEDSKAWKEFANDFQNLAVKRQWVNANAELSWNGVMAGLFLDGL